VPARPAPPLAAAVRAGGPTGLMAALVGVMGLATFSVVRYRPWIVLGYLAAAALLAVVLALPAPVRARLTGGRTAPDRLVPGVGLVLSAACTWWIPTFTYLDRVGATRVRGVLAGSAALAGLVLLVPRVLPRRDGQHGGDLALAIAIAGYLVAATLLLRGDPAPAIDVWYTLQGAADSLAEGRNLYRQVWVGPPGVMAAFTYLPWTALLLAPARWLFGDVRVGLIAATLLAAIAIRFVRPARNDGTAPTRAGAPASAGLAALVLLLPGTSAQVEQAWTEPLLLACLALAAAALTRRRFALAVLALGVGLACKQHLALMLPLLAAWPRFGVRRAVLTALVAGVAALPWLIAGPVAMLEDTVGVLVRYPPMRFADSLYLVGINEFGWTPPFWLTGLVVLLTVALLCRLVHRTDPAPGELLGWAGLVLLVANLVNKQAFYNQYWLVATLLLLGWAAAGLRSERP